MLENMMKSGQSERVAVAEFFEGLEDHDDDQLLAVADCLKAAVDEAIDELAPILKIEQDDDPIDWRKEGDTSLTTMACWHSRYDLGDEQPDVFPTQYLVETFDIGIEEFLKWVEEGDHFDKIGDEDVVRGMDVEKFAEDFQYDLWEFGMSPDTIIEFLETRGDAFFLPLYLLNHSGLSISTGAFQCRWDSGQLGFVYLTLKSFEASGQSDWSRERAMEIMKEEVGCYDDYLTGNVWGYTYGQESCWGYYGDPNKSGLVDDVRALGASEEKIKEALPW